ALVAGTPLALLAGAFGWRAVFVAGAVVVLAAAAAVLLLTRDAPPAGERADGAAAAAPREAADPGAAEGLVGVLRDHRFWRISLVNLGLIGAVLAVQGLWAGPYAADVHGLEPVAVGNLLVALGVGVVLGNALTGWLADTFGRYLTVLVSGALAAGANLLLALAPAGMSPVVLAVVYLALGFSGAFIAVLLGHVREVATPGTLGRAITAVNFFGIGGAMALQWAMGAIVEAGAAANGYGAPAYRPALLLTAGPAGATAPFHLPVAPARRRERLRRARLPARLPAHGRAGGRDDALLPARGARAPPRGPGSEASRRRAVGPARGRGGPRPTRFTRRAPRASRPGRRAPPPARRAAGRRPPARRRRGAPGRRRASPRRRRAGRGPRPRPRRRRARRRARPRRARTCPGRARTRRGAPTSPGYATPRRPPAAGAPRAAAGRARPAPRCRPPAPCPAPSPAGRRRAGRRPRHRGRARARPRSRAAPTAGRRARRRRSLPTRSRPAGRRSRGGRRGRRWSRGSGGRPRRARRGPRRPRPRRAPPPRGGRSAAGTPPQADGSPARSARRVWARGQVTPGRASAPRAAAAHAARRATGARGGGGQEAALLTHDARCYDWRHSCSATWAGAACWPCRRYSVAR